MEALHQSLPPKPPLALALGLHGVVVAVLGLREGPATQVYV